MAEVINLATFQLDTSKLQSSLSTLQDSYFDLRKEQKAYSDQGKETQKQIESLAKTQKLLTDSAGDNSDAIAENEKQMQDLLKTQKDLYKSEQNLAIQMGTVKKEINQTTTQLRAYQDAEGKTNSLIDLGNQALGRSIKNKNDARAANIALNNVANQLNPNIEEEAKLLIQLNAQMDKNTNFIKENSSETAKQKMNIGNYSSALEGLDGILAKFGINGQGARNVVQGFMSTVSKAGNDIVDYSNSAIKATASTLGFKTASQLATQTQAVQTTTTEAQTVANVGLATTTTGVTVATATATVGLRAFTVALASTGIGLIVIALGALYSYLTQTQSGIDALNSVLQPLKSLFSGLVSVANTLGEKLVSTFSNPKKALMDLGDFVKQNLINRFKAFGTILDGILSLDFKKITNGVLQAGTGVENLTGKIANGAKTAGKFLDDNAKKGAEIARIQKQINSEQLKYDANQVAVNDKLDAQLLISKDTSRSFKERANASNEIIRISEANGKQEANILQLKLKQLKTEQSIKGQKNLTNADKRETIALLKEIDDAEDRGLNARLEQTKVLSGLKKEQQAEAIAVSDNNKKLADEEVSKLLEKSKAEIDLFIANQGFKKKSAEEEIKFRNDLYAKEADDLKLQLDKKKISQIQYDTELKRLQNEKLKSDSELVIENANIELDAQLEKNNKILANDQYLSDEQLRIKQEALDAQLVAETNYQALLLEQGVINQKEYDLAIATIKAESKATADELVIANKAAEQEKALIDLDNRKILEEEKFIAQAELEKQRNDILLTQELEAAKKSGADIQLIKDVYAQKDKDIDNAVMQNKLDLVRQTFDRIANLFGENSKAGKAAAIAASTINTYQGITAELATKTITPFEIGLKIANVALIAATGFKAVKNIVATKQPTFKKASYATGVIGLRGAGSGTSDDVSANLSAGESVINARSTSMFANELSAINKAGGGVGLNGASNILNQNEIQSNVNNSQLVGMIAEAVAIGSELGTSKGTQKGIIGLSENRKIMNDAKF